MKPSHAVLMKSIAAESSRAKLHALLGDVIDAEEQLTGTRIRYTDAAKTAGLDQRGLFGECLYVSRPTANSWCADAWERGRAEKDSDPSDNEVVDEITDPDEHEKKKKKGKAKDTKPITDDEDEAPAKPDDPHPEGNAAYYRAVREASAAIISAHMTAIGRMPEQSPADAEYGRILTRAGEQRGTYADQVKAISAAIVAVDRRRRGEA